MVKEGYCYENITLDLPSITTFEFLTEGAVNALVIILGIIGNVISLIALSKPEMRSPVYCGLHCLAFYDTIFLLASMLTPSFPSLGFPISFLCRYTFEVHAFLVKVFYPIGSIAQTGSVWSTVGVTVERYIAVCYPLKARSLCTYRRVRIFNILVFIFSVLYNITRWLEYDVVEQVDPMTNTRIYLFSYSNLRSNKIYQKVYYMWLYPLVMYFVPFLTLAALNVCIWRAVRHVNRNRQSLTSEEGKEIGLAMMLMCVVGVFSLCNILACVAHILINIEIYEHHLFSMSNLLVPLNSAVNFIIYCAFGNKFKKIFLQMFCCCKKRR